MGWIERLGVCMYLDLVGWLIKKIGLLDEYEYST